MKVVILLAAFVAVAYAACGNDGDCAGTACQGHTIPYCNTNSHPHQCACQDPPHKREHIVCTIDADCAAWNHNCHNGDPVCLNHNGEMRCDCPQ